ncbi:MAG: GNAT family N-acetyltransferase, partial [Firmicutes bacterium]|nr:GNAT family N-acetyltransferase [Bacillota bacterium]
MAPIELATQIETSRFTVRPLVSEDYHRLRDLEASLWKEDAIGELCPHYLRLCTELYADWCFLALDRDQPVGYVLNFPKGRVNYCATLAVRPEYQKTKVNYLLIRAMVKKLLEEDMDECRFLVEPDNHEARSVHQSLGARVVREVDDYYREGDRRLWSVIDKADL